MTLVFDHVYEIRFCHRGIQNWWWRRSGRSRLYLKEIHQSLANSISWLWRLQKIDFTLDLKKSVENKPIQIYQWRQLCSTNYLHLSDFLNEIFDSRSLKMWKKIAPNYYRKTDNQLPLTNLLLFHQLPLSYLPANQINQIILSKKCYSTSSPN